MGRFAGLSGVRTNQGGLYFLKDGGQGHGDYDVEIDEIKFLKNRKGLDCFIISARILTSDNPDRAPGCKPSQVITFRPDILETVMGDVKQFAAALSGIEDPDSFEEEADPTIPGDTPEEATDRFWDQAIEYMVSDEQPMRGTKIHLHCVNVPTKSGGEFTRHSWGPLLEGGE